MGREIRRVPEGWEHPLAPNGIDYQPMHDYTEDKIEEINAELVAEGEQPLEREYLPPPGYWDKPHTHYQVYETVSEGTPVSPVFATEDEIVEWLVKDGGVDGPRSREAAKWFVKEEWEPSFVFISTGQKVVSGAMLTEVLARREKKKED